MYNKDSARKNENLSKKIFFSKLFQFSLHSRGPPKILMFDFLKILKKKFQKWLFWDKSNRKRNKVTNFGEPSPTSVEIITKIW